MTIQASVVVPVRNGEKVLPRCLGSLLEQTVSRSDYEIVVVDDGSTDRTFQVARDFGVRLVSQPPQGPSVARNRGVEEALAPIVLFTDADCAPARDWIERMLEPFEDPEVAGVKGTYTSGQKSLTARFVQREYESKYERMAAFPVIDFIDTYSAGFRREAFRAAGGYDPAYETASVEDQEFSFRLHERGAKMLFVPEARVDHFHVDRWPKYLRKKFKIGYYKALLLIQHPDRIKGDSHTPRSLQLQILLLYAMAALWRDRFSFLFSWQARDCFSRLFWLPPFPCLPG
jgi:cellulose synthase/poly-beta-1,6-N-acetylglucosamine synthase-like glycosyltransferase